MPRAFTPRPTAHPPFRDLVNTRRRRDGLTIKQIATLLQVPRLTFEKWVYGLTGPRDPMVRTRLASFFGVPEDKLGFTVDRPRGTSLPETTLKPAPKPTRKPFRAAKGKGQQPRPEVTHQHRLSVLKDLTLADLPRFESRRPRPLLAVPAFAAAAKPSFSIAAFLETNAPSDPSDRWPDRPKLVWSIRLLRLRLCLTKTKLANRVGLTAQQLNDALHSDGLLPADALAAIERLCDLPQGTFRPFTPKKMPRKRREGGRCVIGPDGKALQVASNQTLDDLALAYGLGPLAPDAGPRIDAVMSRVVMAVGQDGGNALWPFAARFCAALAVTLLVRGITQKTFCQALGATPMGLHFWKHGKCCPMPELAVKLADHLGVPREAFGVRVWSCPAGKVIEETYLRKTGSTSLAQARKLMIDKAGSPPRFFALGSRGGKADLSPTGKAIDRHRMQAGVSLRAFAEDAGISQNRLERLRRGTLPTQQEAMAINTAVGREAVTFQLPTPKPQESMGPAAMQAPTPEGSPEEIAAALASIDHRHVPCLLRTHPMAGVLSSTFDLARCLRGIGPDSGTASPRGGRFAFLLRWIRLRLGTGWAEVRTALGLPQSRLAALLDGAISPDVATLERALAMAGLDWTAYPS
jgi:transcriptional regulator with XRE-family HTH domain/DNA-binding XRE family transcriptional regulator